MNKEEKLLETYFGFETLDKLPVNYRFCVIYHHVDQISENEMDTMKRYFSNDKYKSDYAAVLSFYKTI